MKVLIVFALFFALAAGQAFFRVANHVGFNAPQAVSFKQCGVAGTFWVHGKDSGRFGYGVDINAQAAPSGLSNSAAGPVYVAEDTDVGMTAYWDGTNINNYDDGNKIVLRTNNGDASYGLEANCSSYVAAVDASTDSNGYKVYNDVDFFYSYDMRSSSQNWMVHSGPDCTQQTATNTYALSGACSGATCKARVVFELNGNSNQAAYSVSLSQSSASSITITFNSYGANLGSSPAVSIAISNCSGSSCNTVGQFSTVATHHVVSIANGATHGSCSSGRLPLANSA